MSRYTELLKNCLTNTIYGDDNLHPAAGGGFDLKLRHTGDDWPSKAHTMIGMKRLDNLQFCIESVLLDNTPGDFIETGVFRGGACIFMNGMQAAYRLVGEKLRKVYVCDSFEGLPPPEVDRYPQDEGDECHTYPFFTVSLEEVQENFRKYDLLDENVIFVKGWFKDTLPKLDTTFSVIRLDGDMYGSTMDALKALYPKLSPGGFCIIDDYLSHHRCKEATDDYRKENNIEETPIAIDNQGVYWQKSKTES